MLATLEYLAQVDHFEILRRVNCKCSSEHMGLHAAACTEYQIFLFLLFLRRYSQSWYWSNRGDVVAEGLHAFQFIAIEMWDLQKGVFTPSYKDHRVTANPETANCHDFSSVECILDCVLLAGVNLLILPIVAHSELVSMWIDQCIAFAKALFVNYLLIELALES